MAVITFSREYGTYGEQIARRVAEVRNIPLVNKEDFTALLSEYGMISFEEFYDKEQSRLSRLLKDNEDHVRVLNEAILAYAKQDQLVIQGRGSFNVLQGYSNVLNVLIKGPFDKRVRQVMLEQKIDDQLEAAKLVEQHDRIRNDFLQTYYHVGTNDMSQFDLVIDSAVIPLELAQAWIQDAADHLDRGQLRGVRSTRTIEVDTVMEEAVLKALHS